MTSVSVKSKKIDIKLNFMGNWLNFSFFHTKKSPLHFQSSFSQLLPYFHLLKVGGWRDGRRGLTHVVNMRIGRPQLVLVLAAPLEELLAELGALLCLAQVHFDVVFHLERRLDVLQEAHKDWHYKGNCD